MAIGQENKEYTVSDTVKAEVIDITNINISTKRKVGTFTFECYEYVRDESNDIILIDGKKQIQRTFKAKIDCGVDDYNAVFGHMPSGSIPLGGEMETKLLEILKREYPDFDALEYMSIDDTIEL